MLNLIISVVPIILLIWMMTKKNSYPSHIALPVTALLVGLIQLFYFEANTTLLAANIVTGVLSAITPISIIAGAILLNRTLAVSGAEDVIRQWLEGVSKNQVAQLMIIGWAFAFMIEGASGFGTPAAIAAPILVGLFIIPVLALKFVVSWQQIRRNFIFIQLSALSCTVPYLLLAQWNYEFPALIGGAIGMTISIFIAKAGIGLSKETETNTENTVEKLPFKTVLTAMAPTLILIAILIVTRIQQLGIKGLLNDATPLFNLHLGFADLSISQALIIKLSDVFGTNASWAYKTLYVPALIPFFVVVLISIPLLKMSSAQSKQVVTETLSRIKMPFIALVGALIMVKFMMIGGDHSPIMTTGKAFSELTGKNWQFFASYLGALGAFFSGSATVSNLTFGGIQQTLVVRWVTWCVLITSLRCRPF